jgi:hypothetical protein
MNSHGYGLQLGAPSSVQMTRVQVAILGHVMFQSFAFE